MQRTRRRPLPAHQVTPQAALTFGFVLGAISFLFLGITTNVLAASLALSAIAFYVFVYTMWLKRTSTQNIVIGGAAGAAPALVGWAAVTGAVGLPRLDPVRDHLRVDAAALLGARDAVLGGLRGRRRPDAAVGARPGRDAQADPPVLARAVRDDAAAGAVRADGPVLRRDRGGARRQCSSTGAAAVPRTPRRHWRCGLFKYSILYLALLFAAVAVDGGLSDRRPRLAGRRAPRRRSRRAARRARPELCLLTAPRIGSATGPPESAT